MNSNIDNLISEAKNRFEKDLATSGYSAITGSSRQLENILYTANPVNGHSYLDIGTGTGFIAFAIARSFPKATVTGIDLSEKIINLNNENAQSEGLTNLSFKVFEGKSFPFADNSFDGVFCRYAFHHFPLPDSSVKEIARIVKEGGFCFITDPVPSEDDTYNFADDFSRLRKDGHIKYHPINELNEIFNKAGFTAESVFFDEITFPRDYDSSYEALIGNIPASLKESYKLKIESNKLYISLSVMNTLFRK
jgi:SAM-dependent methyltransferase